MILVSELCRNESCLLGKKTKQKRAGFLENRCASHLRALCRVIGEEDCGHSVTTVVRVIRSVASYTMFCAQTRPPPLQTRPALVTRPERLTLKSRQDTFSDHYWARKGDDYDYDCDESEHKSSPSEFSQSLARSCKLRMHTS